MSFQSFDGALELFGQPLAAITERDPASPGNASAPPHPPLSPGQGRRRQGTAA